MRYDEVAAKKAKAARFVRDVREDHDRADEIESESVEDYAERKKLTINPLERKIATVGNDSMTKAELQDCLDQVEAILTDAYDPLTNREDAMSAIADALDVIEGNAPEDDGDADDSDDDQGD